MSILQITKYYNTNRINKAWWDAKQKENGEWSVHFHADYVDRTYWTATDHNDMMTKIHIEMNQWHHAIDLRYAELKAKWEAEKNG